MAAPLMLVDDDLLALASLTQTLRHHLQLRLLRHTRTPLWRCAGIKNQLFAVVMTEFNMSDINGFGLFR